MCVVCALISGSSDEVCVCALTLRMRHAYQIGQSPSSQSVSGQSADNGTPSEALKLLLKRIAVSEQLD